jgi:hypothetical protein
VILEFLRLRSRAPCSVLPFAVARTKIAGCSFRSLILEVCGIWVK